MTRLFPALRSVVLMAVILCIGCSNDNNSSSRETAGIIIEVDPLGYTRYDKPVEVMFDEISLTEYRMPPSDFSCQTITLQEIDNDRNVIDREVPFQIDSIAGDTEDSGLRYELVFILEGTTAVHHKRLYLLSFSGSDTSKNRDFRPLITVTDSVYHEEQDSYNIETGNATYYYHKLGAGFASMEDGDGNDWLGYRPGGKSAGEYRGIPNMGYPEGYCHPGKTVSHSKLLKNGPLTTRIYSESNDGKWSCMWDIFPDYARMTVLKTSHPYWFLYEGTPGGSLDEDSDYCVRPDGNEIIRTLLGEKWEGDITVPPGEGEWIYFGDGARVLYLVHHEDDAETDSYWPMNGDMTVFGFGRLNLNKYMTELPAHFTIGFSDAVEDDIETVIHASYQPLKIDLSPVQK